MRVYQFFILCILALPSYLNVASVQANDYLSPEAARDRIAEVKRSIAPKLEEISRLHAFLLKAEPGRLVTIKFTIDDSNTAQGRTEVVNQVGNHFFIGCEDDDTMTSHSVPC